MTIHEMVILWTARAAVGCMLVRATLTARRLGAVPARSECFVWSAGCVLFLLHVAAAFQFEHNWSHEAAWRHTAAQTAAVTGWDWGGGLYLNYLFTLLWVADAVWDWHVCLTGRNVLPRLQIALRWFLAFIVFNATVVFGHRGWWVAAAVLVLALLWTRRMRRSSE